MSNAVNNFSELSAQKSFTLASYLSSLISTIGGALTLNDIAILMGIFLAMLTFAINWFYQARRDHREKILLQAQLGALPSKNTTIDKNMTKQKENAA
ncbi:HP1 family phage holin [Shewanella baltica]|uniref:Holin n=1 Tax=Shewanella baltica (strain OS155 / ATCC BAA-1091) TaxID=325240 RepID=A3D250_SHEB5|nr:HP1 family phage holin [Shewanella baltica]ABN60813.1 conserved hypothetical protein [Shewanella baltica OS155]AEH13163.1 hypothetical protein Sbal117_1401 [Shewanella baltica OS117]MCS6178958.1 hypothetical protein [Shewanella baltica]MCS6255122.1 hypothetical protein [Shewanella baltica]MDR9767691.1 HP1 family phage holin [Shewanella baltica]